MQNVFQVSIAHKIKYYTYNKKIIKTIIIKKLIHKLLFAKSCSCRKFQNHNKILNLLDLSLSCHRFSVAQLRERSLLFLILTDVCSFSRVNFNYNIVMLIFTSHKFIHLMYCVSRVLGLNMIQICGDSPQIMVHLSSWAACPVACSREDLMPASASPTCVDSGLDKAFNCEKSICHGHAKKKKIQNSECKKLLSVYHTVLILCNPSIFI